MKRRLWFLLAFILCEHVAHSLPFTTSRQYESLQQQLDDDESTPVVLGNVLRNDQFHVRSLEKSPEEVSENAELKRKMALMLVRNILLQGDILREDQQFTLDDMLLGSDPLTCKACLVGASFIQEVFQSTTGHSLIVDVAMVVCLALKIEDKRVCTMAVDEFKDMAFYLIFNLTPEELCYWGLKTSGVGSCSKPVNFPPEWNITLPAGTKPPYKPPILPFPGNPRSKFLFFTDMHMDVRYKEGSSAVCGEPLCCRDNDPDPTNEINKAWQFGDYRSCDMPYWTVDGMMKSVSDKDIDFIVYAGDIPAHDVWNQTSTDQIDKINRWTSTIKKHLPNTPVYSTLGNHESAPVNSYPPHSIFSQPGANISWLYKTVRDSWSNWIPEKDLETVLQGGFYTTVIRKGLRIVSLNTNLCSDNSWWLLVGNNSVDPEGQLHWFAQVMQKAEDSEEKVFIVSHRRTSSCMKSWSWNYYKIINRYQNSIITQLFGHAHTDEIILYYDVDSSISRVAATALIGPAFTSNSLKNPGYRIYTMDGDYDGTSNMLLDGESYFLNISEANIHGYQNWSLEYSFSGDYMMRNLSPLEFQLLIERFDGDDQLFQVYHQHISKSANMSFCDAACKQSTLCSIKKFRSGDHSFCDKSPLSSSSSKNILL